MQIEIAADTFSWQQRVPPPVSISAAAREFLSAATAAPDWPPYPEPGDAAGWIQWTADLEQMTAAMLTGPDLSSQVDCHSVELGGASAYLATPRGDARTTEHGVVLDIHGGALVVAGGEACRYMGMLTALRTGGPCYAVDYRMPPRHPFPAALDDCVAAYAALVDEHGAENIVVTGLSAGGNLAAALVLRARDEGLPMPAGLVLLSPELDLTESGDSFQVNLGADVVLRRGLKEINLLYANGHDLAYPYLSPLFGDFKAGFPPTFLHAGTRDLFLSNVVRMHSALRKAAVPVELMICEGMPHGGFGGAPEDLDVAAEVRRFVESRWQTNGVNAATSRCARSISDRNPDSI